MGRRNYYCDYCDKRMKDDVNIRRMHTQSLAHQIAMNAEYSKYKDIPTILFEESAKRPCSRFASGQCKFASMCRFSHFTAEQICQMRQDLAYHQHAKQSTLNGFEANFAKQWTIDESIIEHHRHQLELHENRIDEHPPVFQHEVHGIIAKWDNSNKNN